MTSFLRRLRCALRPSWHPGFISYPVVLPHCFGLSRTAPVVRWTWPRCVDCGEAE